MRPLCWIRSPYSSKSKYTHGRHNGRFDRYKRESSASYSGRPFSMPQATDIERCQDVGKGVSRGRSRGNLKAQTFKCK